MPSPIQATGHETRVPRGLTIAHMVAASAIDTAERALGAAIATLPRPDGLAVEAAASDIAVAWVGFLAERHGFSVESAIADYERARGGER